MDLNLPCQIHGIDSNNYACINREERIEPSEVHIDNSKCNYKAKSMSKAYKVYKIVADKINQDIIDIF